METYVRLLRPSDTVVLEDPDRGSWHFNPPVKACQKLITFICEAFERCGEGEAGRKHLELLRSFNIEGNVRAEVLALPPGHPYLRLPLHFSIGLQPRLRSFADAEELNRLNQEVKKRASGTRALGHHIHSNPVLGSDLTTIMT